MLDDIYDDPELQAYLRHAETEMIPKMKESAFAITIGSDTPDIKLCLEIGAAVLLDKPLIVVMPKGKRVPVNLRRVASAIIEGDPGEPDIQEKLQKAMTAIITEDRRTRQ
jgi:hypothetical protein